MGGGEAGAGRCERCGQIGLVHQKAWVFLCNECRRNYEIEAIRLGKRDMVDKGGVDAKTKAEQTARSKH